VRDHGDQELPERLSILGERVGQRVRLEADVGQVVEGLVARLQQSPRLAHPCLHGGDEASSAALYLAPTLEDHLEPLEDGGEALHLDPLRGVRLGEQPQCE